MKTNLSNSSSNTVKKYRYENFADLVRGILMARIWINWALIETRQRYRRSVIGSFWITLNLAVMIGGLSLVFGTLFNQNIASFVPYVAAGLICWQSIATLINGGCDIFISSSENILRYNLPISTYVFKSISIFIINFAHLFLVMILVIVIFDTEVNQYTLLLIPALIILCLNGIWFSMLFGILCLRYRDMPMIVNNLVQVSFFITPVFWDSSRLGSKEYFINFNPFTHFIQIFREPLLGHLPSMLNYYVTGGITLTGMVLATLVWVKFRHRIAYFL